ncbi:imidazole glycerol phosphate synthase HisHF [Choiromyces venosus 120613-1]|uniref:Imidazole glycerol phosphate synthase hisHF n=1 Tax=Choiromyces venosus 120613-1 TaxID=1336337 RepID=A0A3N4IW70_9PEZI|nr:imidazole glycerol phosphate synthase HisHF [Choiromyces venosus 120613-1]
MDKVTGRPCGRRTNYSQRVIFPGVGHFGHCMQTLSKAGYVEPLEAFINSGKPFMGICVGLQALFTASEESPSTPGLGIIPGTLKLFDPSTKSVPHIGWNSAATREGIEGSFYGLRPHSKYYYVHSYAVPVADSIMADGWDIATGIYGEEEFIGAIGKGNVFATQFHPEKSGVAGLRVLKAFLDGNRISPLPDALSASAVENSKQGGLTRRIIACLDVRTNDQGDLVVTKGDQYDVREKSAEGTSQVRNLGKPVELAKRYFEDGADEITFLNITSFRNCPLADLPMLEILRQTSKTVFVPLTIGGGIKDVVDPDGTVHPALEVATLYFKSGADKVSIGTDAVTAAEEYYSSNKTLSGKTAIETISKAYGNQAVVVSVDPKRVYVPSPASTAHTTIKTAFLGPNGEEYCWYQCTIKGGREGRDMDVHQLVRAVEAMGAGEILLNCIDKDGSNSGFDLELIDAVKGAVGIPVIASSGAGVPAHFVEVFERTEGDAALGAGMFHRREYTVRQVKQYLAEKGLLVRDAEEGEGEDI